MIRKNLFWIHLAAGLLAALPLAAMATTGILLSFRPQILAFGRAVPAPAPGAAGPSLPLDALVARATGGHGGKVTAVSLDADPSRPVAIRAGKESTWTIDPRDGRILDATGPVERAFSAVEGLHRWLGSREIGGKVTGVSVLLCLILSATGLALWWPRSLRALRLAARPRRGLRGRVRDRQWHGAVGAFALPFLIVLSLTGTVMSWKWAEAILYAAAGSEPPRREERIRPSGGESGGRRSREGSFVGARTGTPPSTDGKWQSWADTARAHAPTGWTTAWISPPARDGAGASVNFRTRREPIPSGGTVVLRPDGSFASWKPARTDPATRLRFAVKPLHTGELFGIAGQAAMAIASGALLLLCWTGVSLAWRRFRLQPD